MTSIIRAAILHVILFASVICQGQSKSICITIDDLPVVSMDPSPERSRYITDNLLRNLKKYGVPAIGFVNEIKLSKHNTPSADMQELLRQWAMDGFELGNHTFSHIDINSHSLEEIEDEIVNGEKFTNMLFASKIDRVKYFRHPYLHTGNTPEKKAGYALLLKKYNYVEAPVTVDNGDYIFARAYDIAFEQRDNKMMGQIGKAYVPYMVSKVEYYESQASLLFNRNISHILLTHANAINADYLDDLLDALKAKDFRFVSMDETLNDNAYSNTDNFIGNAGISWVHRWMITQKRPRTDFGDEPKVPDFILKYAGIASE